MGIKCVAGYCSNTHREGVSLHAFPREPERRKKWVSFVRATRKDWKEPRKYDYLCSAHFSDKWFVNNPRLRKDLGCLGKTRYRLSGEAVPDILRPGAKPDTDSSRTPRSAFQKREHLRFWDQLCRSEDLSNLGLPEGYHHQFPGINQPQKGCSTANSKLESSSTVIAGEVGHKTTKQSEIEVEVKDQKEQFCTSNMADGLHSVDSGSSSEFVVDEACILELFKLCRKCNKQCTIEKHVTGLKLVVSQTCCFCENRFQWCNLPDEATPNNT